MSNPTKETMNLTVNSQKSLCLSDRLKSAHLYLSFLHSRMFMRYFGTIIRITITAMH
jgi:hypothetical protein